jgi:alkylated DNA nucleotide flippase Atl1
MDMKRAMWERESETWERVIGEERRLEIKGNRGSKSQEMAEGDGVLTWNGKKRDE